jgi:hypothetical protein
MTDIPTCCPHCAIVRAIDIYSEANSPANVDEVVGGLLSVMAELIAFYPDRNDRRRRVKEAVGSLSGMVSECRAAGRYPGGPGVLSDARH